MHFEFHVCSSLNLVGQVLKSHSGLVSSRHLSEELDKLHITYMDANSRLKSVGGADSSTSDGGGSDDIEAEANIYFHQMFSGQLTNEATVQMLARFKESTEKRSILRKSTYTFFKLPALGKWVMHLLFTSLLL